MKFNARAPKALSELVCLGSLLVCFGISLTGSAAFAAGAATGTIAMSWGTVGAEQNLGVRAIAVNRRGGASGAASVRCTTVNNTAVAGKDFTAINKVLTWASGDGADQDCNVTISDATPFTGQKTFYIRLSDASGAPLGTQSQTTVTIYGNQGGGLVSLSAATYTATHLVHGQQDRRGRACRRARRKPGLDQIRHRDDQRHSCAPDSDEQ
jgi:hypothetical protein